MCCSMGAKTRKKRSLMDPRERPPAYMALLLDNGCMGLGLVLPSEGEKEGWAERARTWGRAAKDLLPPELSATGIATAPISL